MNCQLDKGVTVIETPAALERTIKFKEHEFKSVLQKYAVDNTEFSDNTAHWSASALKGQPQFKEGTLPLSKEIRILDVYSGCGGMAQGVVNAVSALGFTPVINAAVDLDSEALEIYERNLKPIKTFNKSVTSLVHYQLWSEKGKECFAVTPTITKELKQFVGKTHILIGGPPCQGHSGFNNHTRGADDRNKLYLTMPALGIALGASIIIIENVTRITKDKSDVVEKTKNILEKEGYNVEPIILSADDFGVAQKRERHFLVASTGSLINLKKIVESIKVTPITVQESLMDLNEVDNCEIFNSFSTLTEENKSRIDYLFDNQLYDLPDHVRPKCHQDGHTYPSVYGRLKPNSVSNTITTGFMSPGRGRYIHPFLRRCLTPHEAARLQGFSDLFSFKKANGEYPSLSTLQKVIGDAVPPQLSFVASFAALLSNELHNDE